MIIENPKKAPKIAENITESLQIVLTNNTENHRKLPKNITEYHRKAKTITEIPQNCPKVPQNMTEYFKKTLNSRIKNSKNPNPIIACNEFSIRQ